MGMLKEYQAAFYANYDGRLLEFGDYPGRCEDEACEAFERDLEAWGFDLERGWIGVGGYEYR